MRDEKIYIGQTIRLKGTFRDPDTGNQIDPGVVSVIFKDPDNNEIAADVVHVATGVYYGSLLMTKHGRWYWRMMSELPGAAAKEGAFDVMPTSFTI